MKKNEEQLLETENSSITIEQLDETSLDTITGGQLSGYSMMTDGFAIRKTQERSHGSSRMNEYKPGP